MILCAVVILSVLTDSQSNSDPDLKTVQKQYDAGLVFAMQDGLGRAFIFTHITRALPLSC